MDGGLVAVLVAVAGGSAFAELVRACIAAWQKAAEQRGKRQRNLASAVELAYKWQQCAYDTRTVALDHGIKRDELPLGPEETVESMFGREYESIIYSQFPPRKL